MSDDWLLAAGLIAWGIVLTAVGTIVARLVMQAKNLRVLRADSHADSIYVARQFAGLGGDVNVSPLDPATPISSPTSAVGGYTPESTSAVPLSIRISGAVDLFAEAMSLPSRFVLAPEQFSLAGLTREEIDRFSPVVHRIAEKHDDDSVTVEEVACCVICLDDIQRSEKRRVLPCAHEFHPLCIQLWLRRVSRCPACQVKVVATSHGEKTVSEPPSSFLEQQ
jgi:hypothetical protein